jgi:uncharacterized protein (TIGR02646 family)
MVEIGHMLSEPASLTAFRTANPAATWDALPLAPEKRELRHQLNWEQDGLCVYCEANLAVDEGHVEHIKSKTLNPPLTFVYDNLAHSCHGPGHCGHCKRRQVLPIEPRPGANKFFALSGITGELSPAIGLPATDRQRAAQTLQMLGLNNHPGLNRQRQQYALTLQSLSTPADCTSFLSTAPFRWSLKCL